ncbi:Uncharacterised protein [Mycobacteroides abscessus subsp. abscessus]|nr:Uncharacterised protein [Mycobacteroides abscessus subsp. abscessus]
MVDVTKGIHVRPPHGDLGDECEISDTQTALTCGLRRTIQILWCRHNNNLMSTLREDGSGMLVARNDTYPVDDTGRSGRGTHGCGPS